MNKSPILYIGEKVGMWDDGQIEEDVAIDPLNGTSVVMRSSNGIIRFVEATHKLDKSMIHIKDEI